MNRLYYGDNLDVLREQIPDESVDLIYLDPPFNSNANYNVLFKSPKGEQSEAQITAFEDTWHWTRESARTLEQLKFKHGELAELLDLMVRQFGHNDLSAYLVMMAVRLVELHRVLKPTGSLYLHCDPTASHYLKMLLDMIFGVKNFRNEVIWHYKRWPAKQKNYQRMHDVILFYSKEYSRNTFNVIYNELSKGTQKTDEESAGAPADDVWDIAVINSQAKERLGYPTQKPLALLERIIQASSNSGDIVLDPFCGCGTTIHAAQKLGRRWIGIDVTHLAISLIERRLKDAFPGLSFEVYGTPEDMDGARDLASRDKYQFQWWAVSLLDAVPYGGKKKGADSGIDGWRYMVAGKSDVSRAIISVKGGENLGVGMVRDLRGVIERERAEAGILVTLVQPTGPMEAEAAKAGFFDTPFGRFPRIQIMTVEQLLAGAKPKLPPLALEAAFRKAAREYDLEAKQGDLLAVDIPAVLRGEASERSGRGKRA